MNIIAIETCHQFCSVSLGQNGNIVQTITDKEASKQAENLIGNIEILLLENNLLLKDIDNILVTVGPGSFTGLRIGIAAAIGLKIATGVKITAITSFESLLGSVDVEFQKCCTLINAFRNQYYIQYFDKDFNPIQEPSVIDSQDLVLSDDILYVGNVEINAKNKIYVPNISADLALKFIRKIKSLPTRDLEPLYIREPDAVKSADRL